MKKVLLALLILIPYNKGFCMEERMDTNSLLENAQQLLAQNEQKKHQHDPCNLITSFVNSNLVGASDNDIVELARIAVQLDATAQLRKPLIAACAEFIAHKSFIKSKIGRLPTSQLVTKYEAGFVYGPFSITYNANRAPVFKGNDDKVSGNSRKRGKWCTQTHTWLTALACRLSPEINECITQALVKRKVGENLKTFNNSGLGCERIKFCSLHYAPHQRFLALASNEGVIYYFDLHKKWAYGHQDSRKSFAPHQGPITALSFSGNGELMASASEDKKIVIGRPNSASCNEGYEQSRIEPQIGGAIRSLAFSPYDDERIVSGGDNKTVYVWDISSANPVVETECDDEITHVTYFDDNTVVACAGNCAQWYDVRAKKIAQTVNCQSHISTADFSPDGSQLLITGNGFKIYDVRNLSDEIPTPYCEYFLSEDYDYANIVDSEGYFSPLGNQILINDGKHIRVISLAGGNEISVHDLPGLFSSTYGTIRRCCYSPDGSEIAEIYVDQFVRPCAARYKLLKSTLNLAADDVTPMKALADHYTV